MADIIEMAEDGQPVVAATAEPEQVREIICETPDGGSVTIPLHEKVSNAFHKEFVGAVREAQSKAAALDREQAKISGPIAVAKEAGELTLEESVELRKYMRENLSQLTESAQQIRDGKRDIAEELHEKLRVAIIARHKLTEAQRKLVESAEFWDLQDREEWAKAVLYFRRRMGV